jgi:hypothetical protein
MFQFSLQDMAKDAFQSGFTAAIFRQIPKRISVPLFIVSVLLGTSIVVGVTAYLAIAQESSPQVWVFWGLCVLGLATHTCILVALCSGKGYWFVVADLLLALCIIAGPAAIAGWMPVA